MVEVWGSSPTGLASPMCVGSLTKILGSLGFERDFNHLVRFQCEARAVAALNHAHISRSTRLNERLASTLLKVELVTLLPASRGTVSIDTRLSERLPYHPGVWRHA
jgi:hypothetical protein